MKQENNHWLRLDNAGKIFPATDSRRKTAVFRFSCELTETVDPALLQTALDTALESFPHFQSVMRSGLFWFYLEQVPSLRPQVRPEPGQLCGPLYRRGRRNLLFEVSYYRCRISLEIYHALTDGTGAIAFLKTLLYHYLRLKHGAVFAGCPVPEDDTPLFQRSEDSFRRYYEKERISTTGEMRRAFRLNGRSLDAYQLIEGVVPAGQLTGLAKLYGVSVSTLLAALMMLSVYEVMPHNQAQRPVVLTVPVNLRKRFPSGTARNFFGNIRIDYDFAGGLPTLEELCRTNAASLARELDNARLLQKLNKLMALERNPLIKVAPLPFKNFCMSIARRLSDRGETMVMSNLGRVELPEAMQPYVRLISACTGAYRLQACICTVGDTAVISFTSMLDRTDIQCAFFRQLSGLGIDVHIRSNQYQGGEHDAVL